MLVDAFDRAGQYDAGTQLIRWASKETDTKIGFAASLNEWLAMRSYIPRRILVRCELGRLPDWAKKGWSFSPNSRRPVRAAPDDSRRPP